MEIFNAGSEQYKKDKCVFSNGQEEAAKEKGGADGHN